jgi:ribose transport system permease protein
MTAARIAGLNVTFYMIRPSVISGALSAVAVTVIAAQIRSIDPFAADLQPCHSARAAG